MPNQILANKEKVIEQETIEKNTEQEKKNSIVNKDITIKEETESKNNSVKIKIIASNDHMLLITSPHIKFIFKNI